MQYLAIFLGGGLGSLSRFLVSKWLNPVSPQFFIGTFTANMLSCIVLGFVTALFVIKSGSENVRLAIAVGFCGGFSTFSTFSNEIITLFQKQQWLPAIVYTFASLVGCGFAILLGGYLAKNIVK